MYEGEWKNDRKHGRGIYVWGEGTEFDGDIFEGEFEDGLRSGKGTYTWKDGRKYVGQWEKDKQNGQGVMS